MTAPMRTCVGCRTREPQNKLIRIVFADGRAIPATTKTIAGRSAYLHQDSGCIENAVSRKLLVRALKAQSNLDVTAVLDLISTN